MIRALLFAVVVSLAFVSIASADDPVAAPGRWTSNDVGIVWTTPNTGYLVYPNGVVTAADLVWSKTVDGGVTWSTPVTIMADNPTTTCETAPGLSVWYDRWTAGNSGTRIHIAWIHNSQSAGSCSNAGTGDSIKYVYLDTASDALGTIASSPVTNWSGQCLPNCSISVVRAIGGDIYIHAMPTNSSFQQRFLRSTDGGASFVTRSLGPGGTGFVGMLTTGNVDPDILGIEPNDVFAFTRLGEYLFYQVSSNLWFTDSTISPLSGTACSTTLNAQRPCMTRAINPTIPSPTSTTGTTFFGVMTDSIIGNPHEFHVISITTGATPRLRTPVFTNRINIQAISLIWDDTANHLYAVYLDPVNDEVLYKVSTDNAITWGAELRFDDTVNGKDFVLLASTVGLGGGRFLPVWQEAPDLVTNLDNAITLIGEAPTDEESFDDRLDRFVTGTGFTGASGRLWFASLTSMLLVGIMLLFRAPMMVTFAVVGMYSTLMTLVGYLPFGIYLSAVTLCGVLLLFLVVKSMNGGSEGEL